MDHQFWLTTLGAILTLAVFSLLYKENVVYRYAEHIFLGVATGYGVVVAWKEVLQPKWYKPMMEGGVWPWMFALVAGLSWYTIYSRTYEWTSRLLIGAFMGLAAGETFRAFGTLYMPQITSSFKPLITQSIGESINNVVVFITLITVLSYFFFAFRYEHKALKVSSQTGRYLLMIAFGAIFGSTVMARLSLFIERVHFLLGDWLHLIH
jgi:hypothetical protein